MFHSSTTPSQGKDLAAICGNGPIDRRRTRNGVRRRSQLHWHSMPIRRCRLHLPGHLPPGTDDPGYPELDALQVRYFVRADAWSPVVDIAQATGLSVHQVVRAIVVLMASKVVRCDQHRPTSRSWVLLK